MAKKKSKGLGNPLAVMAAGEAVKNVPKPVVGLVVVGGVSLAGFLVYKAFQGVNALLESFNLKDTKEEKENQDLVDKATGTNIDKYREFDPNFWTSLGSTILVYTEEYSKAQAKVIDSAWGTFNDDEEKVYGVFNSARSKAHISRIAQEYLKYTGKDLLYDMKSRLSSDELAQVIRITQSKPTSVTK